MVAAVRPTRNVQAKVAVEVYVAMYKSQDLKIGGVDTMVALRNALPVSVVRPQNELAKCPRRRN